MKKFTKLVLSVVASFTLVSCGGGLDGSDSDYSGDSSYNNNDSTSNNSNSLSVYNLAGYSIVDSDGYYIDFCSDGSVYYYLNSNGSHNGDYNVVHGTKVDFYDNAGGTYAIETGNGYFEVGETYEVQGVEYFSVNKIMDADC